MWIDTSYYSENSFKSHFSGHMLVQWVFILDMRDCEVDGDFEVNWCDMEFSSPVCKVFISCAGLIWH